MRVILLAAGTATRLRPLTDSLPKCLLPVGAKSILARAVGILADHGLRQFTVVDGYLGELVREALVRDFPAEFFTFVRNERYAMIPVGKQFGGLYCRAGHPLLRKGDRLATFVGRTRSRSLWPPFAEQTRTYTELRTAGASSLRQITSPWCSTTSRWLNTMGSPCRSLTCSPCASATPTGAAASHSFMPPSCT